MAGHEDPAPLSTTEQLRRERAARALEKRRAGQEPSAAEAAALRQVEAEREETLRWHYYRSIPQKHWREMSGRQARTIKEQAERYAIPFGAAEIRLPDVVKALHDFFARHKRVLAAAQQPTTADSVAESTRRIKAAEAELAERRAQIARGDVVPLAQHLAERRELLGYLKTLHQRAKVELRAQLIGRTKADQQAVGRIIDDYFNARWRELVDGQERRRSDEATERRKQ